MNRVSWAPERDLPPLICPLPSAPEEGFRISGVGGQGPQFSAGSGIREASCTGSSFLRICSVRDRLSVGVLSPLRSHARPIPCPPSPVPTHPSAHCVAMPHPCPSSRPLPGVCIPAVQQHAALLCAQGHPGGCPLPGEDPDRRGRNEGEQSSAYRLPQGGAGMGLAGVVNPGSQCRNPGL